MEYEAFFLIGAVLLLVLDLSTRALARYVIVLSLDFCVTRRKEGIKLYPQTQTRIYALAFSTIYTLTHSYTHSQRAHTKTEEQKKGKFSTALLPIQSILSKGTLSKEQSYHMVRS